MQHVIVVRTENSRLKRDATGAFMPEAQALLELLMRRREKVFKYPLEDYDFSDTPSPVCLPIHSLSVFCHGWPKGVEALPRGPQGAKETAQWMKDVGCEHLNLFTCNAARKGPEGCFAQWVAEECHRLGHVVQIYGHETRGHTSWNPKIRFWWSTRYGVTTESLYDPGQDTKEERRAFRKRLKEDQKYRLLLPFIFDEDEQEEGS